MNPCKKIGANYASLMDTQNKIMLEVLKTIIPNRYKYLEAIYKEVFGQMRVEITKEFEKCFPYTTLYIKKYGDEDLAPVNLIPPIYRTIKGKPAEGLYKHCLNVGKTWRECAKIPPDGAIV